MLDSKGPPSYTPPNQNNPINQHSQNYHQQSYRAQQHAMEPSIQEIKGGDWQSSLCDCSPCGSCMLASCVPCLLVGRTSSRLQDPTSASPDMCNGDCMIHGLLSLVGFGWIYTMTKRGDIRERFMIPGSQFGDCCTAFWCSCCQIIQADNEVKARLAPKVDRTGYQPQRDGMVAY